jgi:hypothetical protein
VDRRASALTLTNRAVPVLNSTDIDYPKSAKKKLGEMLASKPVKNLIGKLGEVIVYRPYDKAAQEYKDVLASAKKNLPLFK